MTNLTISLDAVCTGGDHFTLGAVVNGQQKRAYKTTRDELRAPLTEDEIEHAIKVLIRIHSIGKTPAQVRSTLLAGLALVI